jgi:hypothetical protein
MSYVIREMRSEPTAQIVRDLDRDHEAVLNFVLDLLPRVNAGESRTLGS